MTKSTESPRKKLDSIGNAWESLGEELATILEEFPPRRSLVPRCNSPFCKSCASLKSSGGSPEKLPSAPEPDLWEIRNGSVVMYTYNRTVAEDYKVAPNIVRGMYYVKEETP